MVHRPTAKQAAFLLLACREALYGGAAGGGKSDALLLAALQYVDVPGYAALLLRRSLTDLNLPGALLDRTHEWLRGTTARWSANDKTYHFPSGATLSFGYLEREADKYRYQSSEFQFIGFDELTQFQESEYTYLISRLRRPLGMCVPLRMRSASNPGGIGHDWVRHRFVDAPSHQSGDRVFIPARLSDNPFLDQDHYRRGLESLDALTRSQLLDGTWDSGDESLLSIESILACEHPSTLWSQTKSVNSRTSRQANGRPPRRISSRSLYLGIDIGRSRDPTVIWTWELVGDICWCREIAVLNQQPFAEQKSEIRSRISSRVVRCAIDKGGIGLQLSEELEREYPGVVEGVQLNSSVQGRLAQRLAIAFSQQRLRIPQEDDLRRDLRQVRRGRRIGGCETVETDRSSVGHADRFWAAALGYDAMLATAAETPSSASLPQTLAPKPRRQTIVR